MKNEEKIIELLAEMVQNQDQTNQRLDQTNQRLENLEHQVEKLNVQTQENTRAIVKLADKLEDFANHEQRIVKLENEVFK